MKKILAGFFIAALVVSVIAATTTPLLRAFLQSNLDGNSFSITNLSALSASTITNTGLTSAHAIATDSNGKEIAASLVESDIASLATDLSQRVLTNDSRNLVFTGPTNHFSGKVGMSEDVNPDTGIEQLTFGPNPSYHLGIGYTEYGSTAGFIASTWSDNLVEFDIRLGGTAPANNVARFIGTQGDLFVSGQFIATNGFGAYSTIDADFTTGIIMQAGKTHTVKRYLTWKDYNGVDTHRVGANANNSFVIYDNVTGIHPFYSASSIEGGGLDLNSVAGGVMRLQFENVIGGSTAGVEIYGGTTTPPLLAGFKNSGIWLTNTTVAGLTNAGLKSADAIATDSNGKEIAATAISMAHIAQPGVILTNGGITAIVQSNTFAVDAAHQFIASNLTTGRVLMGRADSGITNVSASGAVPVNADGTATTAAQISALVTINSDSFTNSITSQSANYAIQASDRYVLLTGAHTATLPTAVGIPGRQFTVKCSSSGTNAILTTSSQTIDGFTKWTNTAVGKFVTVISDNANWRVVGWGPN